ncbi:hypothetical protein AAFF_G00262530 [Aldrovandia affinis]|uniref:Uncharacterized protein n=1 Tax=Aldrovandia affinis TaxID=143900 RepID=A0AAD7SSY3_9TELE|nr:hypothetical protein AAFF_G00262530 [Aldrovandia affinis]
MEIKMEEHDYCAAPKAAALDDATGESLKGKVERLDLQAVQVHHRFGLRFATYHYFMAFWCLIEPEITKTVWVTWARNGISQQ